MRTPLTAPFVKWSRTCNTCDVRWNGGPICWNCYAPTFRPGEEKVWQAMTWDERIELIREVRDDESQTQAP